MAEGTITVTEHALTELKNALATAGEDYKNDLSRLINLMNEITRGDIKGDPADQLLSNFQAKEEQFKRLAETIDEAQEYMGIKGQKFGAMIGELSGGMK